MNEMKLSRRYYFIFILHVYLSFSNAGEYTGSSSSSVNIPDGLILGAASSAFQIEGAWNISGKSPSQLDWAVHNNRKVFPRVADVSSDSYHRYKEDVNILKYIGLNYYRFSLSWPRLLPTGRTDFVNPDGVRYYHALLDELELHGIEPFITIHHFDHPRVLEEEFGGWQSEAMVELFADYARFVFKEFGHRVKKFVTINEPYTLCYRFLGWWQKDKAATENLTSVYHCGHNMLKAHARAYRIYDEEFRARQNGIVSIALDCEDYIPKHNTKDDLLAAEVAFQFHCCGWMAHPIYSKTGDYPEIMKRRIGENSRFEGLELSRLPSFTKEWIDYIKGTADYFAVNFYLSYLVEPALETKDTIWVDDTGITKSFASNWEITTSGFSVVPGGIRRMLRNIKKAYGDPTIYILENGYADAGHIDDLSRINYVRSHLKEVIDAINQDKCKIKAYTYWSLLDNFEFTHGFNAHFGLAHIDFNDANRTRTLKKSATWLRNVITTKTLH